MPMEFRISVLVLLVEQQQHVFECVVKTKEHTLTVSSQITRYFCFQFVLQGLEPKEVFESQSNCTECGGYFGQKIQPKSGFELNLNKFQKIVVNLRVP